MTYVAPLDDMRFVLNHLAGLPEIATLPGFEDAAPDLVAHIESGVRTQPVAQR